MNTTQLTITVVPFQTMNIYMGNSDITVNCRRLTEIADTKTELSVTFIMCVTCRNVTSPCAHHEGIKGEKRQNSILSLSIK